jgi:hypothetical protein
MEYYLFMKASLASLANKQSVEGGYRANTSPPYTLEEG